MRNQVELISADGIVRRPAHHATRHDRRPHARGSITAGSHRHRHAAPKPPAIRTSRSTASASSPATTSSVSTSCRARWRSSAPGVIGCEYASIFAALGVRVTLIDQRHRLLPFVDDEIADELCHHLRENRVTLAARRERRAASEWSRRYTATGSACISTAARRSSPKRRCIRSAAPARPASSIWPPPASQPDERGRLVVDERIRTPAPAHLCASAT